MKLVSVAPLRSAATPTPAGRPLPATAPPSAPLGWLDALKGIAILAVAFDHAFIVDDYLLWKHAYFHVSWFIFLAGVSNTISARRRGFAPLRDAPRFWRRRAVALLGPFLWVSLLAYLLLDRDRLSLTAFLRDVALFRALPPLYFLALLLQLLAAFPLLYWALYRAGRWGRLLAGAGVAITGAVLSRHVTFPWPLGAHYLLGASFLYLFALGMAAAPLLAERPPRPRTLALACLPVFAWAEWQVVRSDGAVLTHPPSNVHVVYALALLGLALATCRAFPRAAPVRLAAALGRRSLAIFLWHYLFLLPFLALRDRPWTDQLSLVHAQAVVVAVAIPIAVAGSLAAARASAASRRPLVRTLQRLRAAMIREVGTSHRHRGRRRQGRAYRPAGRVRPLSGWR